MRRLSRNGLELRGADAEPRVGPSLLSSHPSSIMNVNRIMVSSIPSAPSGEGAVRTYRQVSSLLQAGRLPPAPLDAVL